LDEDDSYDKTASMPQPTSPEKKSVLKRLASSSSSAVEQQRRQQQQDIITVRCTPIRLSDDFGAVIVLIKD
jgi:hypothetical protein